MALDTRAKRISVLDWDSPSSEGMPIPDGSFSLADRQNLLNSPSGLLWAEPAMLESSAGGIKLGMGLGIPSYGMR